MMIVDFKLTKGDVLAVLTSHATLRDIPDLGFSDSYIEKVMGDLDIDAIEWAGACFANLDDQTSFVHDLVAEMLRDLGYIHGPSPYLH